MKSTDFKLTRYDADDGMVFDWAVPRYIQDEEGNDIQERLMVKTLFIGGQDSIDNYIEVKESEV